MTENYASQGGAARLTDRLDTANRGSNDSNTGLISFWQVISVLRRWWWLIALIMTIITAVTAVILFRITPVYQATSLLEVRQEERNVIDVSAVESVVVDREFLTTQVELLQSQSLIQDTIESLNLLSDPYLANVESEEWSSLSREQRMRSVVDRFDQNLNVSTVGRSLLIEVSFDHANPRKAAEITNALTENFISNGLARKFNSTAFARDFLEERLKTVRASLEAAERQLVAYATENGIIIVSGEDPEESSGSLDITALKTLSAELTTASIERVSAQTAYEQSASNNFGADVLDSDALSRLKSERVALNSEYLEKQALYKPGFPEMVELKGRIDLFDKEIAMKTAEIVDAQRVDLKLAYEQALSKEQNLAARVRALKASVVNVREKSIDYNILQRQVETERTQYDALLARLKEVSVSDDLGSNLVEVVDRAQSPKNPFKPDRLRGLLLALLLSGGLGFAIAYAIEMIDDHVKSPDDVKHKLGQVIMGVIPMGKNPEDFATELANPQTTTAEAYASLRTNLQFSGGDGGPRIIQVTSTRSGEGKSVTSLATALRFAGAGHKTLLIDADMRLPTFLDGAGQRSVGLSGVLTSSTEFKDAVKSTKYDLLSLLPSGTIVPNPSEILSSSRFDALLDWASENYDYVIVDGPPVLGLADAPVLGAKVDATLLVVETGRLRTPNIKASLDRLVSSGTKVLGVVLTKYKAQNKGYMDYYQYSYGNDASQYKTSQKKQTPERKAKRKFSLT
ncbi:GumC family protein [Fretibacter rubidus]|uniref:GumC family protein n=1 Tax=Fretibacter rubidus TaxID=570162 RepID=UPI003529E051